VTEIPPPRLGSSCGSRVLHRFLSRHADARPVRAARRGAERAVELLHSEDANPETNGEYALLRRLGPERLGTVVDVGASRGSWSREVLRIRPDARVFASELSEPTRELLRRTLPGAVVLEGLLDREGEVEVKHYPDDDRLTSVHDYPHPLAAERRRERVTTGDRVAAEHGIERIDLLKIDAEGADLAVLRGFGKMLGAGRIRVVQFEYGYASVLARGFLLDFFELLEPLGYAIGEVHRHGVEPLRYRLERENFFGPNLAAVLRSEPGLLDLVVGGH